MNNVTAVIVRRIAVLLFALCCGASPLASAVDAQAPEQQDAFRPLSELPPQEQLPSAPLLVGAYSFVVVGLFLYLWSVARRLTAVQREVERLEADVKRRGRT